MNRRTSVILLIAVAVCACLYQEAVAKRPVKDFFAKHQSKADDKPAESQGAEGSDKWTPFEPYTKPQFSMPTADESPESVAEATSRDFLWNPLKFILRLILIVTYPPRFILRFFFTFAAVFFLVLFNCQVIPEVRCVARVKDMIPGIMDGLKEELDFYASLKDDDE